MRTLTEAFLVIASLATVASVGRDRRILSGSQPLFLLAGFGVLGLALGGRMEPRLWGLGGAAYVFSIAIRVLGGRRFRPEVDGGMPPISAARLVVVFVIFIWLFCVDLAVGPNPDEHLVAYGIVGAAIAMSVFVAERGGFDPAAVARVGLVVVGFSDVGGVVQGDPWRPCDQFKCSSLGALFRGPFVSENSLAFISTMAMVWTLTAVRGRTRWLGIVLCVATNFATASRTGLIVCGISLVGWAVFRRFSSYRGYERALPWPVAIGMSFGVSLVAWELLNRSNPSSFSNRGEVWAQALAAVRGHEFVGVGLSSYSVLQSQGLASIHFTHSEYLLLLFAGGYGAMMLFAVWGAVAMRVVTRSAGSLVAAVPVLAFMTYGLTEATWNPLALDAFAWIALALTLTAGESSVAAPEPVRQMS